MQLWTKACINDFWKVFVVESFL